MADIKQYDSRIYIGGKRISQMTETAIDFFQESFLCIEMDEKKENYIIRIEDNLPAEKINRFTKKYHSCKIIPYKRISLSDLR